MITRLSPALLFLAMSLCGVHAASTRKQRPPNVVILLADDLGWSDVSVHAGGTISTPNIDRLFREGVELSNFMVWPVCSPTRAMLLTGRHPFRVGTGPEVGGELAPTETTIARAFKLNGYRTGVFGKWHNGEDPDTPEYRAAFEEAWKALPNKKLVEGYGANAHGFDEAWVYYGGGADFFTRRTVQNRGPVSWWHNREFRPNDAGYTDDLVTQHAVDFIRENRETPFLCYVPFHIVHDPLQAKDSDLLEVDAAVGDETKRAYEAMVRAMDKNVARILAELDKNQLRDNTIILFSSDNGATPNGSNRPLRGGKHSVWEGGTRVPTVVHWPGAKLEQHSWTGLCGAMDLMPTLISMAGLSMPETLPLDGKDIWPALRDSAPSPVDSYYWVWHDRDAIRTADWRMHRLTHRVELYNMQADPNETTEVSEQHPEVVRLLTQKMDGWSQSLNAALSHLPVRKALDAEPHPEGEVLEVKVTVSPTALPRDTLVVPFASSVVTQYASDYMEFDIARSPDSLESGFFYTPFKGNDPANFSLTFRRGEGLDQFGREQVYAPAPRGEPGTWEHRVIGLCSSAPGILPRHGLVFRGGKPGIYTVYLDNLRIRHQDGSTTPIWTNGKDTRSPRIEDSALFSGVSVRAVSASAVLRKAQ
jgi:arylsulfatase A-like enzyme